MVVYAITAVKKGKGSKIAVKKRKENGKAEKTVDEDDLVLCSSTSNKENEEEKRKFCLWRMLKCLQRQVCNVLLMVKLSTHSQKTHGSATLATEINKSAQGSLGNMSATKKSALHESPPS